MKHTLLIFCTLCSVVAHRADASIIISGSSVTEILDSRGSAAATYIIGYFESDSIPSSEAEWNSFTQLATVGPKNLGVQDQYDPKRPTPSPGQFGFSETMNTRADIGLLLETDYPRRLGIRFFNAAGNEWNTVTAGNSGWSVREPEAVPPPLGSDLNLANPDLVWQFSSNPFQTVPEPSQSLLCALATLCLVYFRRR